MRALKSNDKRVLSRTTHKTTSKKKNNKEKIRDSFDRDVKIYSDDGKNVHLKESETIKTNKRGKTRSKFRSVFKEYDGKGGVKKEVIKKKSRNGNIVKDKTKFK